MLSRDPDQIWLDMCQPGPAQERAIHFCRNIKFLQVYAENRERRRVSLDPEENNVRSVGGICIRDFWLS